MDFELLFVILLFWCFAISGVSIMFASFYTTKIVEQYKQRVGIFEWNIGYKHWKQAKFLVDQYKRNVLTDIKNKNDFEYFIICYSIWKYSTMSFIALFIVFAFYSQY